VGWGDDDAIEIVPAGLNIYLALELDFNLENPRYIFPATEITSLISWGKKLTRGLDAYQ
jgi:hypothetical protein